MIVMMVLTKFTVVGNKVVVGHMAAPEILFPSRPLNMHFCLCFLSCSEAPVIGSNMMAK